MSDDKAHDQKAAASTAAPAPSTPAAPPTDKPVDKAVDKAGGEKLTGLMASGTPPAASSTSSPARTAPDLEHEAMRAAEAAIAEGERALATARAHLQPAPATVAQPTDGGRRELALRVLLAVNVLAMVIVAMLPAGRGDEVATTAPQTTTASHEAAEAERKRFNEPFNNALAAADRGRFPEAITILERYLQDNPRMAPSQRLNVLNMLSHYAANANDFKKSQAYAQQAASIGQSHSLPADLVEMAKAALAKGDQETLRRVWARFLLQQRQIPSWLYKHVAEAYLQLGDSYRLEADAAADRARQRELEELALRLREQAAQEKNK